jgi:hypothetical protein
MNQESFTIKANLSYEGRSGIVEYNGALGLTASAADIDKITDPDEVVCTDKEITIVFDYPLESAVEFHFKSDKGFTRLDFYKLIRATYERIYDAEDAACGQTGNQPGLLNRARSNGPYGIWGHVIGDLCIEKVIRMSNGKYELSMGS